MDAARGGGAGADGRTKAQVAAEEDALQKELGFGTHVDGEDRIGWMINASSTQVEDKESGKAYAAVNCYFMAQDGSTFKAQVKYAPYFLSRHEDWVRARGGGAVEEEIRRTSAGRGDGG